MPNQILWRSWMLAVLALGCAGNSAAPGSTPEMMASGGSFGRGGAAAGGAGSGGAPAAGGAIGTGGEMGAGGTGAGGSIGAGGNLGMGGASGPPGAGGAPVNSDAATAGSGGTGPGPASGKVLVYTHSTGFRHDSIEAQAEAMRAGLAAAGFTVEVSADAKRFTTAALATLRGVVFISTTGKPLGDPGTDALAALQAFVRGGGALVGIHAASSTFYEPSAPYTQVIGGRFVEHPGGVRDASCSPSGAHPAVAGLPATFATKDEIYVMDSLRNENQVVLTCAAFTGNTRLPIAWVRNEGTGRVFYTALGHNASDFKADARLYKDHFLPGALWALGR